MSYRRYGMRNRAVSKSVSDGVREKTREEKMRAVLEVIKDFSKKGREETAFLLSENNFWGKVDVIPTGILSLDLALTVGGIPIGRIIEIEGMAGTGKSSLALTIARAFQNNGGFVLYVDMEHALYRGSMEVFGLDPEATVISQPVSGEEALDLIRAMVQKEAVDLIILDSLASLTFSQEAEKETADGTGIGLLARKFSGFLRVVYPQMENKDITMIVINQLRQEVSSVNKSFIGPRYTSPGGMAKLFYSSVTLRSFKTSNSEYLEKLIESGKASGHTVRFHVEKNRFGIIPGMRDIYLDLIYGKGFDVHSDLANLALELGAVSKSGSWYNVPGFPDKVQGKNELIRVLKENPEVFDKVRKVTIANFLKKLESNEFSMEEESLEEPSELDNPQSEE
jgi:recombination protein RecA